MLPVPTALVFCPYSLRNETCWGTDLSRRGTVHGRKSHAHGPQAPSTTPRLTTRVFSGTLLWLQGSTLSRENQAFHVFETPVFLMLELLDRTQSYSSLLLLKYFLIEKKNQEPA